LFTKRKKILIIIGIIFLIPVFFIIGFVALIAIDELPKNAAYRRSVSEREAEKAAIDKRFKEFSNMDLSYFLTIINENNPAYFVQPGQHWNQNVNSLFEVKIEDNAPILYEIDFLNEERIIRRRMVLKDTNFSQIGHIFIFQIGKRSQSGHMIEHLHFEEKDGEINFGVVNGGQGLAMHPSKDINKILAELSNPRKSTQALYTGRYVFERIEIISDIGSTADLFKNQQDEINIAFTRAGNFYMWSNNDKSTRMFFYIGDDEIPRMFVQVADGGGGSLEQYYYFEKDYLIFYFNSYFNAGFGSGYDMPEHTAYRIYYKKSTNGL